MASSSGWWLSINRALVGVFRDDVDYELIPPREQSRKIIT